MAWTAPMTAIPGDVFTAAQFNTYVRDNFNDIKTTVDAHTVDLAGNPRALATTSGQMPISTGSGALQMRAAGSAFVAAQQTTTSTTYVTLTGNPAVTAITGTSAMITLHAVVNNTTAGAHNYMVVQVTGSTTITGATIETNNGYAYSRLQAASSKQGMSGTIIVTGLNAGSNTFTVNYRTDTGTAGFENRLLVVQPIF